MSDEFVRVGLFLVVMLLEFNAELENFVFRSTAKIRRRRGLRARSGSEEIRAVFADPQVADLEALFDAINAAGIGTDSDWPATTSSWRKGGRRPRFHSADCNSF